MDLHVGIRARTDQLVKRAIADERAKSLSDFSAKAGLGRGHVRAVINGEMNPSLSTLERIAAFAQVSLEYLIFGRENLPPVGLPVEVDAHRSPAFAPAARAFLELQKHSAEANAVVRSLMAAQFNAAHVWSPEEWLEELLDEHTRRVRGLRP